MYSYVIVLRPKWYSGVRGFWPVEELQTGLLGVTKWRGVGVHMIYDIYLLNAIGLTPGGSSTVHIYTQTIHRTTQSTQTIHRTTQFTNWEECGTCPVFVRYTLAFALQMRKKYGKTSVRVVEEEDG